MQITCKEIHDCCFLLVATGLGMNHFHPPQATFREMKTRHPRKVARFSHFESEAGNLDKNTSKEMLTVIFLLVATCAGTNTIKINLFYQPQANFREMKTRHPRKITSFSHFESEARNLDEKHE